MDEFTFRDIVVPRGAEDGHLIFLQGVGNENLVTTAGDLIVRVNVLKNDIFDRDENDLIIKVNITLKEALLGFNRTIVHLNGTKITIVHQEITVPGEEFVWDGMGMPKLPKLEEKEKEKDENSNMEFGRLIMRVNVVLPERLKEHQSQAFLSALGN